MCDHEAMTDLKQLTNKRFKVPETNTRRFEPTLAEKRKALKRQPNYAIIKRPSLAVGDDGTQQKSPSK
jgi:hypothetical protein